MKTRIRAMVLTLVATCALCCSLPSPAFAWNLDYYTDSVFASNHGLERGDYIGQQLYNYGVEANNAFWAGLGQSPAFNAAIQCINNDYLRGTYFTVHDIYDVMVVHNNTIAKISTNVTTVGTLIWQIQPVIDDIKDDLDDVLDNQLVIGTALGNINNYLSTINTAVTNPVAIWNTHALTSSTNNSLGYRLESINSNLEDISILYGDILDAVADIGTYVDYTHSDLQYLIQNGIDIANWPQSFVDLTNIENYLRRIFNQLGTYNSDSGIASFRSMIRDIFASDSSVNGRLSLYQLLKTMLNLTSPNISGNATLYSVVKGIGLSLSNISDDIGDIISMLAAGNVQDAVGDFNNVQFDANVDTLTSRIATLAPFGAVLMVAAELDMLQTRAVDSPEMDLDFDFAGSHEVVHIDLSYLDTVQPFINWIVIILLVYGLLWYTVDFVKLEAAS